MYNGKAYVNTSNKQVPVYKLNSAQTAITNTQIGVIYPNECFGVHTGEGCALIAFRDGAGNVQIGGFGSVQPTFTLYGERISDGSTLLVNKPDSQGYYVHTLSKNMNWYIDSTKQGVLEAGTKVRIQNCQTGSTHYYRIACKEARTPSQFSFHALNPGGVFWVDFLTLGSMPNNRSIW